MIGEYTFFYISRKVLLFSSVWFEITKNHLDRARGKKTSECNDENS